MHRLDIHKVSLVAILVALSVATNYALVGLPNVNLMDFIVFVGGFSFGPVVGALIGILSWAVYGVLNPYGFLLQVYLATMFTEAIYGIVGGLLGKNLGSINFKGRYAKLSILFGIFAWMLTLAYDMITNVVYAAAFDIPIILAIIFGVPFMFIHVFTNIAIFSLGSVPVIKAIRQILR